VKEVKPLFQLSYKTMKINISLVFPLNSTFIVSFNYSHSHSRILIKLNNPQVFRIHSTAICIVLTVFAVKQIYSHNEMRGVQAVYVLGSHCFTVE
jgi:hypothetical protein